VGVRQSSASAAQYFSSETSRNKDDDAISLPGTIYGSAIDEITA